MRRTANTKALLLLLNDEGQLAVIRTSIIDQICMLLDQRRELLDAWELVHLADAISALSLNIYSLQQPTNSWLRLCLHDLELALKPRMRRAGFDAAGRGQQERPTYVQLRSTIEAIAAKIGHSLP